MPNGLLESLTSVVLPPLFGFALAPGIVTNNIDGLVEGRVQVRIPARPGLEPWARLVAVGGGPDRGFYWVPQVDDEVMIAFHQGDERDAYLLGGLWNTRDKPPASIQTDALNKRIIRTGIAKAPGHEIEIDDLMQSIKIKTSTDQKLTIDPFKIELEDTGGAKITLDTLTQTITVDAALSIVLKSQGTVKIEGTMVEISGSAMTKISGGIVKIN